MSVATAQSQAAPRIVYLDNQATTPLDPAVFEAMTPFFKAAFGNPHSATHGVGSAASVAVEAARAQVGGLIGADAREIIFTSGATESNNLAVKGAGLFQARRIGDGARKTVIVSAIEHKCVLESARALAAEGFTVKTAPVGPAGLIDLDALSAMIDRDVALVSIMAVNNEMGAVQPLAAIGALTRAAGALFHCDAAQAAGKILLNVDDAKVDLLSLSGHKMHGPMGVGALYIRRRPRARIESLFHGGGQERGLRSGTTPLPLAVGLGVAAARAADGLGHEPERLRALLTRAYRQLSEGIPGLVLNGPELSERSPANLNVQIPGVDAVSLARTLKDVAISTGSACASAAVEPSYVLRAMGLTDEQAASSIRIGFGRMTTEDDAAYGIARIVEAARGAVAN